MQIAQRAPWRPRGADSGVFPGDLARAGSFRLIRTPLELVGESGVFRAMTYQCGAANWPAGAARGFGAGDRELSNRLAYARQVDAFAAAVQGKANFPVPGEEGWQNQLILEAAYAG